jgi:DNA-binding YbaB/EbfC family protein
MKFGMSDIMQQAQKLQEEMQRVQEELKDKIVTAEAGGGMVKVTITGANEIRSIVIEREVINPDDKEMLEDLIVAAVNKAIQTAGEMAQSEMQSVSGMMPNIPGLNFPF